MMYILGGEFKATGVTSFRKNLKKSLDDVYKKQLTLIVTRPEDENVVIISEKEFNRLRKEINNLQYFLKLATSDKQIETEDTNIVDIDDL